jgi:aldose 1-epimerase
LKLTCKPFGTTPEGTDVNLYTFASPNGFEVSITNFGGAITSIKVPDRNGELTDVVLGYESLAEYGRHPRFLGALIGRHANRIAQGRFTLNGIPYQLPQNNGVNHLHGGRGFHKVVWRDAPIENDDAVGVSLNYLSADGEDSYPGNLSVQVNYLVSRNQELRVEYRATSDKDTIVNLTNHSYFNLAGKGDVLGHELQINADKFTPVSAELIPTGEIRSVENTPLDFRAPARIGDRINAPYDQLQFTGGYDHNFVLRESDEQLKLAARAVHPESGHSLEVFTTQPGLQFYSGNFLDGSLTGKSGVAYEKYAAFCLETQHFPDAPNHSNFPSTVLRTGDEYKHDTVFKFG